MKYGELNLGQIEALVNKLGGMDAVRNILSGVVEITTKAISYIVAIFTVTVDETMSVEDAMKAGKFGWSNNNITSANFPKITGGQKWDDKEVTIFHFNKTMTSEAVIAEMDKAGYKPATIWDLLSLGASQPDLQRKFPIVALGSVCKLDGCRRVPCLYGRSSERFLNLDCFGFGWSDYYRFVAVRK